MSEALCGPSNALQQFKQHSSLDRTLQQDRVASRHSPAQGFRSADPNAGFLDPEFEAFQAGPPGSDLPQVSLHHQPPPLVASAAPQSPSWAADFQRMQISPSPVQHQPQLQQPQQPVGPAWAQGFREHVAQSATRGQQGSSPSPLAFQQRARYGLSGLQNHFAPLAPAVQNKGKEPAVEQFDEAAFERAFDQAREDMMAEVEVDTASGGEQLDNVAGMDMADTIAQGQDLLDTLVTNAENAANAEVMRNDEVQGMEEGQQILDERAQQQEDDALATTAQELLERVQDNETDKFRNSQFLGLMRKLADREVRVEGDHMVETGPNAAHVPSATASDPLTTSTRSATASYGPTLASAGTSTLAERPLFDNSEQRPSPLVGAEARGAAVDSRPPDDGFIPAHEQDHDAGRTNPQDGQEVVDLLSQPGALTQDIGTSDNPSEEPFDGNLRGGASANTGNLSEMLYGPSGTLERRAQ